MLNFT